MSAPSSPGLRKFTSQQLLIIALLALTQFTVVLDFMVMSPLGDQLMKTMGLTTRQFGLVVSGYAFSAGISGLLTAGFADRFDRKKLLLFFYTGFIVGTLFCGLAGNYQLLLLARIVTGLFGGVIGSISMAIVADLFPAEKRGRVMGFLQMGFGASQVLGIPVSLFLANRLGWQSPFFMIVVLALAIWLVAALRLPAITAHLQAARSKNAFTHLWHTVRQRDYRIGFLATCMLSLGGYMMMPWGTAFSINNLKLSPDQMVPLFMISGLASLLIMPLVGRFADKVDKFRLFAFASVWMIGMVLVYTNLTPVPFWVVLTMNICFMAGIMGRMVPAMALTSSLPQLQDRGAFMSINASLQQLAGGIAAAVGGMIVVQDTKTSALEHYDTLGYVIAGLTVIATFMVYRVSGLVKRRQSLAKTEAENREQKTTPINTAAAVEEMV